MEGGTEMGGDVNVELKSQWRPSQLRKESIFMGKGSFISKSKGGIRSRNIGPLRREIKHAGVRTAVACLGKLTITWKRS